MDARTQLQRFLAPMSNRIRMMLARAVIKTVNDDTKVQQMSVSILEGELKDKVERFQNYGLSSVPFVDMEALMAFIGGDRSNGVIIGVADRSFRIKGQKAGEVALYTDEGDTILLKRDHNMEFNTKHLAINADDVTYNIKTMQVNATDSVSFKTPIIKSSGEISDKTSSMQKMRDTFNVHPHKESNLPDGETSAPKIMMS